MKQSGRRYIEGETGMQGRLLPWNPDGEIGAENPVRFIRIFVESLDLKEMGFVRARAAHTGRPGYNPGMLLSLYLYGHLNRIRSSRELERESRRNMELWWLLDKLTPDHNTISAFRKENRKALEGVFKAFVNVSVEMELIEGKQICIDGTPVKAVNGMKQSTSRELSREKLKYAKEQLSLVEKYLEELDRADQYEQGRLNKPFALDLSQERLPDAEELRQRIRRHEQALEEMKEQGETQILYTDPEARVMKTKDGGRRACYNVQTAVEPQSHMVVGYDITNDRNDVNNLCSTAQIAKENLYRQNIRAIADKGYESRKDIEKCLMNGIVPDVGFVYDREFRVFNLDYIPANISAEQKASEKGRRHPGLFARRSTAGVL